MDAGRHHEIGVVCQRPNMVASGRVQRQCDDERTARSAGIARGGKTADDEGVQWIARQCAVCVDVDEVHVVPDRGSRGGELGAHSHRLGARHQPATCPPPHADHR